MKVCNKCGAVLPESALFCESCGAALKVSESHNVQLPYDQPPVPGNNQEYYPQGNQVPFYQDPVQPPYQQNYQIPYQQPGNYPYLPQKRSAPLVLGIVGLVFSLIFPLVTYGCSIPGLVMANKDIRMGIPNTAAKVLNIIAIVLAAVNSLFGIILYGSFY